MIMRGLDQSKSADIQVQPSVVSRNGERASVESVKELLYPTEYEPPEMPESISSAFTIVDLTTLETATPTPETAATPSHPTAFESRKTGVRMEVEATVSADKNYINMVIAPELVEFEGFINYGSTINGRTASNIIINPLGLGVPGVTSFFQTAPDFFEITTNAILMPVFKTITTESSSLTIQDGATVVLGGLITSKKTKTEDSIPFLGNLPVAGRLFRSESSHTINQAIIIMVNAEIIDPTGTSWNQR